MILDHGCVLLDSSPDWFSTFLGEGDGFTEEETPNLGVGGTNQ